MADQKSPHSAPRHPKAAEVADAIRPVVISGGRVDRVGLGLRYGMAPSTVARIEDSVRAEVEANTGLSLDSLPPAKDGYTLDTEPLPNSEEEFEAWVRREVSGPAARARRIQALIDLAENGIGVARLQAIKQLDEIAAQYADYQAREESITFRIVGKDLPQLPAPEESK